MTSLGVMSQIYIANSERRFYLVFVEESFWKELENDEGVAVIQRGYLELLGEIKITSQLNVCSQLEGECLD